MPASRQQRVVGLVVNARPRPARAVYDRLEATLYNCVRNGPSGQNRAGHPNFQAHLSGRVGWFLHADPPRGRRLAALLDQIAWDTPEEPATGDLP